MVWLDASLSVEDILKMQELKFYYKHVNNKVPDYFAKPRDITSAKITNSVRNTKKPFYLNLNSDIHQHYTRRKNNLHIARSNHKFAEKCLRHNLRKTLNS